MYKTLSECTDRELSAIVNSTSPTGRYAHTRNLALVEMGRRTAAVIFAQARADRAAARERARRLGCAVQEDFLDH